MNLRLAGSCQVPIAGFCEKNADGYTLQALVGDERDGRLLRAQASSALAEGLGIAVAEQLLRDGAEQMLSRG
jgi:hydroxymethylbilane synthase